MKTLREYIDIIDNRLSEGWWSDFKSKANLYAQLSDFYGAIKYLDKLIIKAKINDINGRDAMTRLMWLNIEEAIGWTKDPELSNILEDIRLTLNHWPEHNTDISKTKELISQLSILKKGLEESDYYLQLQQKYSK